MSGYVIANVSWPNEEARQAYLNLLGPSLTTHGRFKIVLGLTCTFAGGVL